MSLSAVVAAHVANKDKENRSATDDKVQG